MSDSGSEQPTAEQSASPPAPEGSRVGVYALTAGMAVFSLILDLWSKNWAWNNLRNVEGVDPAIADRGVMVIDHVFYLKFGFNTGSAFSFLHDASWARVFFIVISFVALGYMAWLASKFPSKHRYGFLAVGLIAGGTLGNLHDRFFRTMKLWTHGELVDRHGVIDFLQFFYDWDGQRYWPIFNVADSSLVCGVFLLLIYIRRHGGPADLAEDKETESSPTPAS